MGRAPGARGGGGAAGNARGTTPWPGGRMTRRRYVRLTCADEARYLASDVLRRAVEALDAAGEASQRQHEPEADESEATE